MKKALEKISAVLRVAAGVVCAIFTVTFIVLIFTEKPVEVFVFMAVLFAGLTTLLLFPRKRRKQNSAEYSAPAQPVQFEVPEYILQDMRGAYSVMQAKDDAHVMLESHKLVQQTMSMPTFLSRLQLSRQKALTLLQAEKAGIKGLSQIKMTDKCNYILSTSSEAKTAFLERTSFSAITNAFQLKTLAGQRRKLQAYIDELEEHSLDFMEVEHDYRATIERIEAVMP